MIDVVVPYVDFQDKNWIEKANKNGIDYSEINRFRGQGEFFRYFFRGVAKNLSWVGNVFLIVQSKSQVPSWLDTSKIKVVLHEDFIPKEFLPLYNSCTIEMFLGNIKELGEQFLYFNDDMYVLRGLEPSDFFDNNKIRQKFLNHYPSFSDPYGFHCRNGYSLLFNEGEKTPVHSVQPLLKSKVIECFNLYKKEIYNSISTLRTSKNMNVYLYTYYLLQQNLCEDSSVAFSYTSAYDNRFVKGILLSDILCIGDEKTNLNIYRDARINKNFRKIFPEKSKYEL